MYPTCNAALVFPVCYMYHILCYHNHIIQSPYKTLYDRTMVS